MAQDPSITDPDAYRMIFGSNSVRVLAHREKPGYRTQPHQHPDTHCIFVEVKEAAPPEWVSTQTLGPSSS